MAEGESKPICDEILRRYLPNKLRRLIHRLLERGEHPATVLATCRQAAEHHYSILLLAVEHEIANTLNKIHSQENKAGQKHNNPGTD